MIDTIIFDKDGTMFDTERLYYNYFADVFKQYGRRYSMDIHKKVTGTNVKYVSKVFCEELGLNPDRESVKEIADNVILKMFHDIEKNGVPIKSGLTELLKYLKENNYKTAVASSSPRDNIKHNLEKSDLLDYFNCYVGGEEVSRSKPEPDIFLKAAEILESKPENCLVIEDSSAGLRAAHNANMKCICIPDMIMPDDESLDLAEKVYDSLEKVIDYLKEQN